MGDQASKIGEDEWQHVSKRQTQSIAETSFEQKSIEKYDEERNTYQIIENHECKFNENIVRDLIEEYREEW